MKWTKKVVGIAAMILGGVNVGAQQQVFPDKVLNQIATWTSVAAMVATAIQAQKADPKTGKIEKKDSE